MSRALTERFTAHAALALAEERESQLVSTSEERADAAATMLVLALVSLAERAANRDELVALIDHSAHPRGTPALRWTALHERRSKVGGERGGAR